MIKRVHELQADDQKESERVGSERGSCRCTCFQGNVAEPKDTVMSLPTRLLQAIAAHHGGQVVIVAGAGCSVEAPTNLRLAGQCSLDAHDQLVRDAVLGPDECPDASDLTILADTVVAKTHGQTELVKRLPRQPFRQAKPNRGHQLAAALLLERALASVLTLNFDLAFSNALSELGAEGRIAVIPGPENHNDLAAANIIYLHRSVDAEPESWILTSKALQVGWKGGWEAVMASRILSSPVLVFAGLGSPATVLTESLALIRKAVPDGVAVYQVDPGRLAASSFSSQLNIDAGDYLQMGWCEFMDRLAQRVTIEHLGSLGVACAALVTDEGLEDPDVASTLEKLDSEGLIYIGQLRAHWLLSTRTYVTHGEVEPKLLADLLLGVALVESKTGRAARFCDNGIVEFEFEGRVVSFVMATGAGHRRWQSLESRLMEKRADWKRHNPRPLYAIVSGFTGNPNRTSSLPETIIPQTSEESIVDGAGNTLTMIDVDELRLDQKTIERIFIG